MNNIEKILWERFEGGDDRLFRALKDLFEDADRTSGKPGIEFVTSLLERYTFISRNKYDDGIDCDRFTDLVQDCFYNAKPKSNIPVVKEYFTTRISNRIAYWEPSFHYKLQYLINKYLTENYPKP